MSLCFARFRREITRSVEERREHSERDIISQLREFHRTRNSRRTSSSFRLEPLEESARFEQKSR